MDRERWLYVTSGSTQLSEGTNGYVGLLIQCYVPYETAYDLASVPVGHGGFEYLEVSRPAVLRQGQPMNVLNSGATHSGTQFV